MLSIILVLLFAFVALVSQEIWNINNEIKQDLKNSIKERKQAEKELQNTIVNILAEFKSRKILLQKNE